MALQEAPGESAESHRVYVPVDAPSVPVEPRRGSGEPNAITRGEKEPQNGSKSPFLPAVLPEAIEELAGLFVVPCQEVPQRRGLEAGTRALWAAVVVEAIDCLRGTVSGCNGKTAARRARQKRLAEEGARRWFTSEAISVGTFAWICEHLGLEVDPLRRAILSRPVSTTALTRRVRSYAWRLHGKEIR